MIILKTLLFFLGFSSLFTLPVYHGFRIYHLFLILSFTTSIFFIFIKKISITKNELFFFLLWVVYYALTMIGSVISQAYFGILSSQLFIITLLTVFLSYKIDKKNIFFFLKGFIYSAAFTGLFNIIDYIYFINHKKALISVLFPKNLLGENLEHPLTNLTHIGNNIFYRASGFSWDPGLTITGLALAFIMINENLVALKKMSKYILSVLILIGIILSISKTAIITLIIYFILKLIFHKDLHVLYKRNMYISALSIVFISIIIFLLYIGLFVQYNSSLEGYIRHLKYFSSIFYYGNQDILHILFGYGYVGVGKFFNEHVDWLYNVPGFYFGKNLCPESTLTNIFFWGGLMGAIIWIITFLNTLLSSNKSFKLLLIAIVLLMFGYNINTMWFNYIFFSVVLLHANNFLKRVKYENIY